MKNATLIISALLLTAPVAMAKPSLTAQQVTRGVGVEQRIGSKIPMDVPLRDETGKIVSLSTAFADGRPVIFTPVYYDCPMLCGVVLDQLINRLADLRLDVGRDFNIVTYSFNPRETSPEAATKRTMYLKRYGRSSASQGWHFYTGDEAAIRSLSDALGFRYVWDPTTKEYAHAAAVVVATPKGVISHYFQGMEYAARDLRLALVEASENKLGNPIDRLMLLCYDYDPATGKYSAVAMNLVRAGGAATVAGLAGFIFLMIRRDRTAAK